MLPTMLVAGLLLLSSCGGDDQSAATDPAGKFPLTVPSCERTTTIEKPVERVLTVASDSSTTVAAVGAADRIVARAAEGGAPLGSYEDELCDIPQITVSGEPSREIIIAQQPELVVSYGLDIPPENLEAAGIDSIVPSWRCDTTADFDGIFRTLQIYGEVFGTEDTAEPTVADLRRRVSAVQEQFQSSSARTAANVYVSENRLRVYGGPSMSNTVLATARHLIAHSPAKRSLMPRKLTSWLTSLTRRLKRFVVSGELVPALGG